MDGRRHNRGMGPNRIYHFAEDLAPAKKGYCEGHITFT